MTLMTSRVDFVIEVHLLVCVAPPTGHGVLSSPSRFVLVPAMVTFFCIRRAASGLATHSG